jgi:hypothetical protein
MIRSFRKIWDAVVSSIEFLTDSDREYRAAALANLNLPFLDRWSGSPEEVLKARKLIAERRAWADSLDDPKWRRAYVGWCWYAEFKANEAEADYASAQRQRALVPPKQPPEAGR